MAERPSGVTGFPAVPSAGGIGIPAGRLNPDNGLVGGSDTEGDVDGGLITGMVGIVGMLTPTLGGFALGGLAPDTEADAAEADGTEAVADTVGAGVAAVGLTGDAGAVEVEDGLAAGVVTASGVSAGTCARPTAVVPGLSDASTFFASCSPGSAGAPAVSDIACVSVMH